jgi:hypothetical protein
LTGRQNAIQNDEQIAEHSQIVHALKRIAHCLAYLILIVDTLEVNTLESMEGKSICRRIIIDTSTMPGFRVFTALVTDSHET